jgi:hypothetical protein
MTLVIETIDEAQEKALITILEGLHIPYTQRQTVDEYNQELEEGNAAIDKGEFITNDQLKQEIKKW